MWLDLCEIPQLHVGEVTDDGSSPIRKLRQRAERLHTVVGPQHHGSEVLEETEKRTKFFVARVFGFPYPAAEL